MAVFRVEKNANYTTMCNYHLRDQALSLKAKGLNRRRPAFLLGQPSGCPEHKTRRS